MRLAGRDRDERKIWMIHKEFVTTGNGYLARVTFTLPGSLWADAIYLVGDFNDWHRTAHPLNRRRGGEWYIKVNAEKFLAKPKGAFKEAPRIKDQDFGKKLIKDSLKFEEKSKKAGTLKGK